MELRKAVVRGSSHLFVRQGFGLGLSALYFIFVVRYVGPEAYGVFSLGFSVLAVTQQVMSLGLGVYLIRNPDIRKDLIDVSFSYTVLVSLLGLLSSPLLSQLVVLNSQLPVGTFIPLLCIFALLPILMLSIVPQSLLERNLAYKELARIELTSQVIQLGVALSLALASKGVWALIAGAWTQQLTLLLGYWVYSRYKPKWQWSWSGITDILAYGLGYNISFWIWQIRFPLILSLTSRYLGAEAVGIIALTARLVEYISFPKSITWRISIPVLARLQKDKKTLLQAIEEGAFFQTFFTGLLLLCSGFFAPLVVPKLFGNNWSEVPLIFPFVALGTLANATFALHSSALYVLRLNKHVATFHLIHVGILGLSLFFWLPKQGLLGYGLAELTALSSYAVIHSLLVRSAGKVRFILPMGWLVGLGIGLFYPWMGLVAFIPLFIWLLTPASFPTWGRLAKNLSMLRRG